MKRINVLDKYVSELIAAGEVVERPSSVVKELMENSLDAGATKIVVEVKNGGISLIKISDNGSGIYRDDIKDAFLRHATSKVKTSEDLDSIETLGFRGEALASICTVSKVEVLTFCGNEEIGTRYIIEGGDEKTLEDAGRAAGTTFTIRNLFFNTPARMKFLKKDATEANSVSCVVDRISLSHPGVSIKFIRDGKELINTPGDGKISSSIYSIYGKEIFCKMIPVNYELNGVTVKGYISRPEASRSSRSLQNFFINNRYAKLKSASVALEEAFKGFIMAGKYPICAIYVEISHKAVDVNVHPSKIEVRFIDERPIFQAVYYAVKSALENDIHKKEILLVNQNNENQVKNKTFCGIISDFKYGDKDESKISNDEIYTGIKRDTSLLNMRVSDFNTESFYNGGISYQSVKKLEHRYKGSNIDILNDEKEQSQQGCNVEVSTNETCIPCGEPAKKPIVSFENLVDKTIDRETVNIADVANKSGLVKVINKGCNKEEDVNNPLKSALCDKYDKKSFIDIIGEVFGCYIVAQQGMDKIILIDKHAAHERIIYNSLKKSENLVDSQVLLSPIKIFLRKDEYSAIIENLKLLADSGYSVEDFGIGSVIVRGAPVWLSVSDVESSIIEISNYILDNKINLDTTYMEWLYRNISCRAAIKSGNNSSDKEIIDLVKTLEDNPDVMYCPHGRPVYVCIGKKDIEKQFGRV